MVCRAEPTPMHTALEKLRLSLNMEYSSNTSLHASMHVELQCHGLRMPVVSCVFPFPVLHCVFVHVYCFLKKVIRPTLCAGCL